MRLEKEFQFAIYLLILGAVLQIGGSSSVNGTSIGGQMTEICQGLGNVLICGSLVVIIILIMWASMFK